MPAILKPYLRPFYVPIANLNYRLFKKPRRYKYLFESIKDIKAIRITEVGTWNGDRALKMIATAHKVSPVAHIEYYGFDLFEEMTDEMFTAEISKRPPTEAEVNAKLAVSGADVHLYKGNTKEVLPRVVPMLPKMDFIYIDGGHHIDTIRSDWNAVSQLMNERTVVIFDDYWRNRSDHGCKVIIDALDPSIYKTEILPIIDSFDNKEFGRLDISYARVTLRPQM